MLLFESKAKSATAEEEVEQKSIGFDLIKGNQTNLIENVCVDHRRRDENKSDSVN